MSKLVSSGQAWALARSYSLGGSKGFANFVPGWSDSIPEEADKGKIAASLLDAAGADWVSAGAAIEYLKGSKPTTDEGRAYRGARGLALLLKQTLPPVPSSLVERVAVQREKPSQGQLAQVELELAVAHVRLAEAKLRALQSR